jgi:tripartite-type tricarboxylate transporter receptor subunit TctC
MMIFMRWFAAALLCAFAGLAQAQAYPSRPIKFIIPYPPGGLADSFARTLGQSLTDRLGQPVVVENKPGGSLIIGTDAVAKSPADGYTILLGSVSSLGLNVSAFKKLPYDPLKDFSAVSLVFRTPLFLMVAPDLPVKSVKEVIAYAKARPGALSYASLGHGSSLHIAGEQFKKLAGIDVLHVPYKGTTSALPDLMSGRVSMIFDGGAFLPQAKDGRVRLLAVTSAKRLDAMQEVPTMAEAGVPGYELDFWFGIVAPAETPKPIVERLSREIGEIEKQAAFRERMSAFGNVQLETSSPEAMAATIKRDIAVWQKLLSEYKVDPQ